jgi:hypothetical protein
MLAFEIVTIVVCAVSAVVATVAFFQALKLYDRIGQLGTLAISHDDESSAASGSVSERS